MRRYQHHFDRIIAAPGSSRRAGFTLVELLMAVAVTGIIGGAIATFISGVAQGWQQSESSQSVFLTGTQAVNKLQRTLAGAKMLGTCQTGSLDGSGSPAMLMFWMSDTNNDGHIQFSEMACLQHDRPSKTIYLSTVQFPSIWTALQILAADITANPPVLLDAVTFLTSSNVVNTPLVHNVTGAQFFTHNVISTTQRPSLEFVLQLDNGRAQQLQYGTVTLRCPNNEPN